MEDGFAFCVGFSIVLGLTDAIFDVVDDWLARVLEMFAATADADEDGADDDDWLGVARRGTPTDPPPPPELAIARPVVAERLSPPIPGALGP